MIKILIAALIIFAFCAGFFSCLLINRGGWIHYHEDAEKDTIRFEFTDRKLRQLPTKKWYIFRVIRHRN